MFSSVVVDTAASSFAADGAAVAACCSATAVGQIVELVAASTACWPDCLC